MTLIMRHKIELILNNSMRRYFDQCFGYSRYAWNKLLGKRNNNKTTSLNDLLKQFKAEREDWEYAMPSYIPTFEMRNLKATLKNKLTHYKANFKSKKNPKQSFYVPNDRFLNGSFTEFIGKHMKFGIVLGKKCRIRKQDRWMKLTEVPAFYGESGFYIMSATILKEVDRYYVSFCIQIDDMGQTKGTEEVGIDPGVHSVMTLSDGTKYKLPKILKKLERKAIYYQKRMSKRYVRNAKKQSKRYMKATIKHQKTLRRKNQIKRDFLQKATTEIVKKNNFIAWEDCEPKKLMKNHKLARSIGESCWGMIKTMLEQKCTMHGAKFVSVEPQKASTQTCSYCGNRLVGNDKLNLNDRVYRCPICGYIEDRDVNAAKNILKFSKQTLAGAQPSE